jgi:uncharacterized protein (TIGR02284 family)
MDNEDVIDTLNKLIETCKDGEYGFRTCAEHVKSQQLRTVFLERAESCRKGATELQAEVARLGGEPETDSSTTGTLHRGWVNLKGALTGDSDQAALDECERGEDAALARYRDAIKEDLPGDVAAIVQRQYEGVKRNHDQIRSLRNSMRSTAT